MPTGGGISIDLWSELQYVGREATQEQQAYPLFMGFASQVGLVPRFEPLRKPVRLRAEAFQRELLASEPAHLGGHARFRRAGLSPPAGATTEKSELLGLYQTLRNKRVAARSRRSAPCWRACSFRPRFCFIWEQAPPGKRRSRSSDWELASRLSYFLWSSLPDDELRRAAAGGQAARSRPCSQRKRGGCSRTIATRSLAIEFGTQWIHVRGFDAMQGEERAALPDVRRAAPPAMYEESIRFFQDLFQSDRPVDDVARCRLHVPQRDAGQALRHPRRHRPAVAAGRGGEESMAAAASWGWRACRRASRAPRAPARCCAATGSSRRCWAKSFPARRRTSPSCPKKRPATTASPMRQLVERHASVPAVRRVPRAASTLRVFAGAIRRDRPAAAKGTWRAPRSTPR